MRDLWDRFTGWCRAFHSKTSLAHACHYRYLTCLWAYPVPSFEGEQFIRKEMLKENHGRAGFVVLALQKSRG
jgi:hypothetical protein